MQIHLESPIIHTPRVAQLAGIFDLPPSEKSVVDLEVDLTLPQDWNIGLIVGPSGSGKSTVARHLFNNYIVEQWSWDKEKAVVDGFPKDMSIKEITELLNSVGFSSPPAWLRPYHILSNGEKFRVDVARTLSEKPALSVIDEFTSVVDRTVAQIGSAAISKTVRKRNQRLVAVSCHYDIVDWLSPDWIYEPHTNSFDVTRGRLRRPNIHLDVHRVDKSAWQIFRKHHYLNTEAISVSSRCWMATVQDRPVAFAALMHFPHPKAANIKRGHRTVCLPDFQGVGIGNALSNMIGSMCIALGYRYQSQTAHPAMIQYRNRHPYWCMISKPNIKSMTMPRVGDVNIGYRKGANAGPASRLRATFEYVGPAMRYSEAKRMWG